MTEQKPGDYHIYDALKMFFQAYLTQRDAEKTLSMVTEDLYSLGTGAHEVAANKEAFAALVHEEIGRDSTPMHFLLEDYHEKQIAPGVFICICNVETSIQVEGEGDITFRTRLTAGFREENGRYLAYHFHMSEASVTQEEREFFPLRYSTEELRKLNHSSKVELVELMKEVIPGGVMGGYIEPEFPLYIVNDEILNLLGYTYDEFIKDIDEKVANTIHPDDLPLVNKVVDESFAKGNEYRVEYRMRKKDGSYLWVYDIGRKIHTDDGRDAIISVIMDISDEVVLRGQLQEEATKDALTGIYNRRAAAQLIDQYLSKKGTYGFLIMDIDDFKNINDEFGHTTGDQVLVMLAEMAAGLSRQIDICARLGGDEFIMFLPDIPSEAFLKDKADLLNQSYQRKMKKRFPALDTGLSLGGVFGDKKTAFETLYPMADALLYEIKKHGKNGAKVVTL